MKEIIEAFSARIKSPVFGYFVFSWMAINWRALFYLVFSNTAIDDRLGHFDKLTNNYSLVILPLIFASIIAVLYPWINYIFLYFCKKPSDLRNNLQAESEHNLLIKRQNLEEARSGFLAIKEKDLIDRAKRDEDVLSISDIKTKEKLQKEIESSRKDIDNEDKNRSSQSSNWKATSGLGHSLRQLSDLYTRQKKFKEAENTLLEAIEIDRKLNRL